MRKFVLAAAVATSVLGLAACSETATEAGETVDAMAADAEANAEAAGSPHCASVALRASQPKLLPRALRRGTP